MYYMLTYLHHLLSMALPTYNTLYYLQTSVSVGCIIYLQHDAQRNYDTLFKPCKWKED